MQITIIKAIELMYGIKPYGIESLGGGFYGRAFRVTLDREPFTMVAKVYLYEGIGKNEAEQLKLLGKHARLKMPKVYGCFEKAQSGLAYDVLFMEYINGRNAAYVNVAGLLPRSRRNICENIVDNLIGYHSVISEDGFGQIGQGEKFATWQEYYYPIAVSIVKKAERLHEIGQLSDHILTVFKSSIEHFDDIFYLPVTEARLIHGDYNTWNIMLDSDTEKALAVIDPYNCCFADSEYDLYQLDNANGKEYGLLKKYSRKVKLSPNFAVKRCFYELYTEVCHYYDAHVVPNIPAVEELARRLEEEMKEGEWK